MNRSKVAILGSTGSIGRNALEVIENSNGRFKAIALTSHTKLGLAAEQCQQHRPKWLVATCENSLASFGIDAFPSPTVVLSGLENVERIVRDDEVDIVIAAIVGSAGLRGTMAAVQAGKRVALANKESLVMAGEQVMRTVAETGAELIPVDSEHSAIFQALTSGRRDEVKRILLTASGGPFLHSTKAELDQVTVEQALNHPTWKMGPKITVDSATMMNKALEIIEARWLFDYPAEQIQVVVHPQSIVHSMVEFNDGSVIAQMSPPDMKLPIQYALDYPRRTTGVAAKFDWTQSMHLDFEAPDMDRFPALELGYEVARIGGTTGAVVNAANEAAVHEFIEHRLPFNQIVTTCRSVLENHDFDPNPTLDQLETIDQWARKEVLRLTCA